MMQFILSYRFEMSEVQDQSFKEEVNLLIALYTGTRSKIFNEIVFKDNHLLMLHEKCIYRTIKRDMVMQLNFTHLPKSV